MTGTSNIIRLQANGNFPNSPALPVLVLTQVLAEGAERVPHQITSRFAANGWVNSWCNGLYTYHHYHSTAHETLGVASGWVLARLGGDGGPTLRLAAGDVLVLPAGTGHANIDQSPDFLIVGAYPEGQIPDMMYGRDDERTTAAANIRRTGLPRQDPVHGAVGMVHDFWLGDSPAPAQKASRPEDIS